MHNNPIYTFIILFFMICGIAVSPDAKAQSVDASDLQDKGSLQTLEETAKTYLESNQPVRAIEVYQYYENTLSEEGWDYLQPDLLYNQAIACYQAGKTGAAIGYLKQLYLLKPSNETADQIHELQMLIEHSVYRNAPGTMFVRGESNEFAIWRLLQQFSTANLHLTLLLIWTILFGIIGALIIHYHRKRLRVILSIILSLTILVIAILGLMCFEKHRTQHLQFGVLTGTDTLRSAPIDGPEITDQAFVPGITVRIVSATGDWYQVERFDGVRAWLTSNDLYKLHSQEHSKL